MTHIDETYCVFCRDKSMEIRKYVGFSLLDYDAYGAFLTNK